MSDRASNLFSRYFKTPRLEHHADRNIVSWQYSVVALCLALLFGFPASLMGEVSFSFEWDESEGTFSPEQRAVIEYAGSLWSQWIEPSPTGDSVTLHVTIEWDPDSNTAWARNTHRYSLNLNVWQSRAQAAYRLGSSKNAGRIGFGTNPVLGDNPSTWYTGLDGQPPDGERDMLTTALHEIGHLMGMTSLYWGGRESIWQFEGWGMPKPVPDFTLELIQFDRFLRDGEGRVPQPGLFGEVEFEVADPITFVGPHAVARNEGPVPIFAPPEGSNPANIAHPNRFGGLMTYGGRSRSQHGLWDYEVGMFMDLDWRFRYPESMQSRILWGAGHDAWHNGGNWDWGLPPTEQVDVFLHMEDAEEDYELYVSRGNSVVRDLAIGGSSAAQAVLQIVFNGVLTARDVMVGAGDVAANGFLDVFPVDFDRDPGLLRTRSLQVGYDGLGQVQMGEGSRIESQAGSLGINPGSYGSILIRNAGSLWDVRDGRVDVGFGGEGLLQLFSGSSLESESGRVGVEPGSKGSVRVHNLDTKWLNESELQVGVAGEGAVRVQDQARAESASVVLGFEGSGSGILRVSSDSTFAISDELSVGRDGEGQVFILDGQVDSRYGMIGDREQSSGEATVRGDDAVWTNRENLYVGNHGEATLTVERGGQVINQDGYIGFHAASDGVVNVVGADSIWHNVREHGDRTDLFVGKNGRGTLRIAQGGRVVNTYAFIGDQPGSEGTVEVTGENAHWDIAWGRYHSTLYVGNRGSGTMRIEDGGRVDNFIGTIGQEAGSHGQVEVSGNGSIWVNHTLGFTGFGLEVGNHGFGSLTIEDGGAVQNYLGYVGRQSGSEGVATVTGAGSEWTNSTLYVGHEGEALLSIKDGGRVSGAAAYIGYEEGSVGTVEITGEGATWDHAGLWVGFEGSGNMTVADGGEVISDGSSIGLQGGASGSVLVSGTDSKWSNSTFTLAGSGVAELRIEDGGSVQSFISYVGRYADSEADIVIAGEDARWTTDSSLYAGERGRCVIKVKDGGSLATRDARLGCNEGGEGLITVTGSGSRWLNDGQTSLGATPSQQGGVGKLIISDGGSVSNRLGCVVGDGSGSEGSVMVTGEDSVWDIDGAVHVGASGAGTITIENGGSVANTSGSVGVNSGSSGTVTVAGAGSTWENRVDLLIAGAGNGVLKIIDGAEVHNTYARIGNGADAEGSVEVKGQGSAWRNSAWLQVGNIGKGSLSISGGASVTSIGSTYIAVNGSAAEGEVSISGADSIWDIDGALHVGELGSGALNITAGGVVSNTAGHIGVHSDGNGTVLVAGENSRWNNSADIRIGQQGSGLLVIRDGAEVNNENGHISISLDSEGTVSVVGADTLWNNRGNLYIGGTTQGSRGSGKLRLEDGGNVYAQGMSGITVWETGSLRGQGTIGGPVSARGTLAPERGANSAITFLDGVEIEDGAIMEFELFSALEADGYSRIIGPNLHLPSHGTVTIRIVGADGHAIAEGETFNVFDGDLHNFSTEVFSVEDQSDWDGDWAVHGDSGLVLEAVAAPPVTASGIPHSWLEKYNLPTDGSADHTIPEGKDITILEHYVADLDPTKTDSRFSIVAMDYGPPLLITVNPSSDERVYTLQHSSNLADWFDVDDQVAVPGGAGPLIDPTPSENRKHYRVLVELP